MFFRFLTWRQYLWIVRNLQILRFALGAHQPIPFHLQQRTLTGACWFHNRLEPILLWNCKKRILFLSWKCTSQILFVIKESYFFVSYTLTCSPYKPFFGDSFYLFKHFVHISFIIPWLDIEQDGCFCDKCWFLSLFRVVCLQSFCSYPFLRFKKNHICL